MKRILFIFCILAVLFSVVSCKKEDTENKDPKPKPEITLTQSSVTIEIGETYEIKPTVKNYEGTPEYNVTVVNQDIASVNGLVITAQKAGTTDIKVSLKSDELIFSIFKLTVNEEIKPTPVITVIGNDCDIYVGDVVNFTNEVENASKEDVKIEIEDESVVSKDFVAQKVGSTNISFYVEGYPESKKTITVTVTERFVPELSVNVNELELTEDDTYTLVVTANADYTVTLSNDCVTVENLVVTAQKAGSVVITVKLNDYDVYEKINVTVKEKFVPELSVRYTEYELTEEEKFNLIITANAEYTVTVSNDCVTVENNVVTAVKEGTCIITIKLNDYDNECTVTVKVNKLIIDETKPEFELDGVEQNVKLNWNKTFDALKGVKAIDDIDGDISKNIKVIQNIDNQKYGKQTVVYEVSDKAGNTQTYERTVEVVWDYAVSFIGHQGSYYGVPNSEEAFLYGAKVLKYQALECDVKQTKDGVFVTCHDDTFGGVTISNTTYEELSKIVVNSSRTAGYPSQYGEMPGTGKYSSTICTLERYLEICKDYGCIALIELKGSPGISNSDQSRMPALMALIEKVGMLDQTIFLASAYNCLIWVKQNGYDYIPCQYLVDSFASETIFERCKTYGLDVSGCVTYGTGMEANTPEWVARYQDAGIKVSTYTFTQYSDYKDVQKWIDIGVDFVTVDWHTMSKLNLPDNSDIVYHTVKFYDHENNLLKETKVKSGRAAASPIAPKRDGYEFVCWSDSIANVTNDMEVFAEYEAIEYNIAYDNNLYITSKSSWVNKQEFVNEFYTDLFEWIKATYEHDPSMSYSNGVYKVTLSGSTASFSSLEELLAVDIYVFEKALGPKIYKPIPGANSVDYVPVVDSGWFLNTEPYRTKYIEMNKYFLNAIKTGYSAYNDTYTPTSAGKVQIMFRFHQWAKGTNIAAFNTLPNKYTFKYAVGIEAIMPTDHVKYTIEDEFTLSAPTSSIKFLGWYLDRDATGEAVTKIEKGTTGDILLYAKWEEFTIPDVYSNITYELDGGVNSPDNKSTYLEGVATQLYPASKEGYNFLGWSLEQNSTSYIYSIKETNSGNITIYANYEYATFNISYDLQGGTWGNSIEITGSATSTVTSTSNNDFWNGYASNVYLFSGSSYGSGLNATWSERIGITFDDTIGAYAVTSVAKSGSTDFVYADCDYILQLSSSHSNYNSLKGNFTKVEVGFIVKFVGDPTTGSCNVEFYSKDSVSGGTIENYVTEYTIATIPQILPTPKYEGKTFKGWALSANGAPMSSLPIDTIGNITLYAIWE